MAENISQKGSRYTGRWWRSVGPALITACVVFGPGSLLVSANIGATYRTEMLWLLVLTGILMGVYVNMAARVGVVGGASPCRLIAEHAGRGYAVAVGLTLFSICSIFQFGNNLAVAAAARALLPGIHAQWIVVGLNLCIVVLLFTARHVYQFLERMVKVTVALILICFLLNLIAAHPRPAAILKGLIPQIPVGLSFAFPQKADGGIQDPMLLVASLCGTTFSIGAAFYQGNLVREKGWGLQEYRRGIQDTIAGVAVLTTVSAMIMITTATIIPGKNATDVGMLAQSLQPLLGTLSYLAFCLGLLAVSLNPFLINAMIGGGILADGMGMESRLGDKWPKRFTVIVMLIGMVVALLALQTGEKPVRLVIVGQALTVIGNPLMAVSLLWLANRHQIMGTYRNRFLTNVIGGIGLITVLFMALRVFYLIVLKLT
ncbi:MAG: divalent metal cation transporter [Sedimentisphaerales bacterium]|nr:divalent metal cation transporter [Sedimentisphaerales bacterium]